jgi:hypothetical protein
MSRRQRYGPFGNVTRGESRLVLWVRSSPWHCDNFHDIVLREGLERLTEVLSPRRRTAWHRPFGKDI